MKKLSESMVKQMIALIIGLLVIPIMIAGSYLFFQISNDLIAMEKESVHNTNQIAQNLIQNLGQNLLDVNKSNAYWEDYRSAVERKDLDWIKANINSGISITPNLDFVSTYDNNGAILTQSGKTQVFNGKLNTSQILNKVHKKPEFYGLVQTSTGMAIIAVSRVTDENATAAPAGFLVYGRILDKKTLVNIKNTLHSDVALLSNSGTFLTTSKEIKNKTLSSYLNTNRDFFKTNPKSNNAEFASPLKDFSNQTIGLLDISQKQMTSSQIKAQINEFYIIIGFILLVILAGASIVIYRRMIVPIYSLVDISNDVSSGILTEEVNPNILVRKDELGKLGFSINKMIHNFRDLIKELYETTGQVASSAEQLSGNIIETSASIQKISSAIQEVASGTETQLQGAKKSSDTVQEMAAGVQEITHSFSIVSLESSQAAKEAQDGSHAIAQTVKQMDTINKSVNESVDTVTRLSERSQEIGQIVSMITGIANQTNLLALNAAIEAARAGEQGKGFAVVAAEVRVLSEQTAESAKKVSELVEEIQKDSLSSSKSMDQVLEDVQLGVKHVNDTGAVFDQILKATQHLAEQVQKVSAVAEEIAKRIEDVTASVESMAVIAKNSSEHSLSVASASQEQAASMEEINAFVESLNQLAHDLKQLFNKFTI